MSPVAVVIVDVIANFVIGFLIVIIVSFVFLVFRRARERGVSSSGSEGGILLLLSSYEG